METVWIPFTEDYDKDGLRYFTNDEIDEIVTTAIKPSDIPGAGSDAKLIAYEDNINSWKRDIKFLKFSPKDKQNLIDIIRKYHYNSIVPSGLGVGVSAAESCGAVTTQATLNSFHTSGTDKSQINTIELVKSSVKLTVSSAEKFERTTVIFRNKFMSYEEVLNLRPEIIGITIKNLLVDSDIKPIEEFVPEWWHLFDNEFKENIIPDESTYFLRLYLSKIEMYKYRITMKMIVEKLEEENQVICVLSSPSEVGIIDIFLEKDKLQDYISSNFKNVNVMNMEPYFIEKNFFIQIILPSLSQIYISGKKEIQDLIPRRMKTTNIIRRVRPFQEKDFNSIPELKQIIKNIDSVWICHFDMNLISQYGISQEHFYKLCDECDVKILYTDTDDEFSTFCIVKIDEKKDIIEFIESKISAERNIQNEKTSKERLNSKIKMLVLPPTPLLRISEYIYAFSFGKNLSTFLSLPIIDQKRTVSTNVFTMTQYLGIEAARRTYIENFVEIMGEDCSTIHIAILAELAMNRGIPKGAGVGNAQKNAGHLTTASISKASDSIKVSSLFKNEEDSRNVTNSMIIGGRIHIGTGSFDVGQDIIDANGKPLTLINEDVFESHLKNQSVKNLLKIRSSKSSFDETDTEINLDGLMLDYLVADVDFNDNDNEDEEGDCHVEPITGDFEGGDDDYTSNNREYEQNSNTLINSIFSDSNNKVMGTLEESVGTINENPQFSDLVNIYNNIKYENIIPELDNIEEESFEDIIKRKTKKK